MHPIVIKHFSEISAAEYHRIVQAREAVFFLEQHITEPDADEGEDADKDNKNRPVPPVPENRMWYGSVCSVLLSCSARCRRRGRSG